MKKIFVYFALTLFSFSVARSQSTTHEDALQYYKFLLKNTIDISAKVSLLGNRLTDYSVVAGTCENFKLDKARFDTINSLFHETSLLLNKGIFGVIALKEADTAVSVKTTVLLFYKDLNACLSKYFPIFISTFQTGFKDYSKEMVDNLKNSMQHYFTDLQAINTQIDTMEIVSNKFLVKYNLSEYEIMQSGGM